MNANSQTAFIPGNLVVLSVNAATSVSLMEYTISGALVQTIAVPSTGTTAITISGTATSEGALSRSGNGAYLGFVGYRTGANASGTDRVIARVDANGVVNTSSAIPNAEGFTGNNIRGCVFSDNGSRYWASGTGTGGGVRTNLFGALSGSVQVSTTIANARTLHIFNAQLYCAAASGAVQSVAKVGTGLPVTSGNAITALPGLPVVSGASSYGFSMSPGAISNGSVLYVADDRASALGGIQKWIYNAGTWNLSYTLGTGVPNVGARSVTVDYANFNVITGNGSVLYASSAEASSNRIIKIIDNGSGSAATTLATAAVATIFRGITFSPVSNLPPVVSSNSSVATVGIPYSYSITATNSPVSYAVSSLPAGLSLNSSTGVISGTPLTAGTYTITLSATNANGTGTSSLILKICDIQTSVTQTNVLCNGNNTGSAAITATGGLFPYSYSWLPYGGSSSLGTALSAGTFTVNVSDGNGCTTSQLVSITQPIAFTSFGTHNNVSCATYCDGAISMIATGGVSPYSYAWSAPGYFSPIVTNLCAGSYTVTATDLNGCTTNFSAVISQPAPLSIGTTQTPILCNGDASTVNLSGIGGTGPFSFSVYPLGLQTLSTYNLTAGTYSLFVLDANACFAQGAITITEPPLIVPTVAASTVLCTSGNSTVNVSATGGTGSFQYKLDTGLFQISPVFTVAPGTYQITVKDASQCTVTTYLMVDDPLPIVANATATTITCSMNLSTIDVLAVGGTGLLTYQLNSSPVSTFPTFNVTTAGMYTITVQDANGCTVQTTVQVLSTSNLNISEAHTNPSCYGGTGTVTIGASGGTPPYIGTGLFTQFAGTMVYTVSDITGCIATISSTVVEPIAPSFLVGFIPAAPCYGSTVTPIATGVSSYIWSGGLSNNTTFVATSSNTYTVTGQDANGCTASTTIQLNVASQSNQLSLASSGNVSTLNMNAISGDMNTQLDGAQIFYTDTNCDLIALMTDLPGGGQAGATAATLHLDSLIQNYNTQPYLRRWYDIQPTSMAPSQITFFLTQDDFDDYNSANGSYPDLPINGNNADPNIANIRITRITGGAIGTGVGTVITPLMNWNASASYWEATFVDSVPANYYFHSANPMNIALPVTLLDFSGSRYSEGHQLRWIVSNEENCRSYDVLHSKDAIHFESIATIPAFAGQRLADTMHYHTINHTPVSGSNYYKLKQIDIDGQVSVLSKMIEIKENEIEAGQLYPNPTEDLATFSYSSMRQGLLRCKVSDFNGKNIFMAENQVNKGRNLFTFDTSNWVPGVYLFAVYFNDQPFYTGKLSVK